MPADLLTRAVAKAIPSQLAEEKLANGKKLRIYWGIDPTGTKLHLGHTVPLRKLKEFADAGHEVILVIGSFTAMIGDPSDRESMRQPLTEKEVKQNFKDYKKQAAKILDFKKVKVVMNHEWLKKLKFQDILELASHFTEQQMSERQMFAERIKQGKPVGLHEFLYPLMVGYDSVHLDVDCEIGGTDQEFNMLAGRTLQKAFSKRDKFVLTVKLLLGPDGRKMSKTYDNCIYLTDEPNDMYGKIMSIKDDLITGYMECCTDMPTEEIAKAESAMKSGANPKEWKMRLAKEIVTLYHGATAATEAAESFQHIFAEGGVPEDMPQVKVQQGTLLIDVLAEHELVSSKGEARRLIEQGGIKMNDKAVTSIDAKAEQGIVKIGKRKFLKIRL